MAIGGIGGALLAGLEGYSQARQREQQDQQNRIQLAMRQRLLQADLDRQQQEQQAIGGAYAGLAGLGGLGGGMAPAQGPSVQGGGPPDQLMSGSSTPPVNLPQVPAYAPMPRTMQDFGSGGRPSPIGQDVGGGMRAGGALSGIPARGTPERNLLLDRLALRESGNRNIRQGIVPPGGGYNPSVGRVTGPSTAGGPWQITDSTLRDTATGQRTGARSAMDLPVEIQREAANDLIDRRGISPWAPYNPAVRNDPIIRQLVGMQKDPEFRQGVTQVQQSIPPMAQGRLGIVQMRDAIERAMPGADNATKGAALLQLQHMLAPDQKLQLEQAIRQHQEEREDRRTLEQREFQAAQHRETIEHEDLRAGLRGGQRTPHNIEVTDSEGKTVYKGAGVMTPQGFAKPDGSLVAVPEGGSVSMAGTGGGRQAATQIQAIIGSGNELLGELTNLMDLPKTATLGIFQGLQGMPANEMGEAMKRSMANKLTPEEQTDLLTSFQGVARSLATIEAQGRATGLVGLTEQARTMAPQANDTIGNTLRKMATMRQILERGLETVQANRDISPEQKVLMKKMLAEVEKTIPFTVAEVNKMQHGDVETLRQAAAKLGLGGGGEAGGGPPKEAIADLKKDPSPERKKQFDEVFGQGASDRALK